MLGVVRLGFSERCVGVGRDRLVTAIAVWLTGLVLLSPAVGLASSRTRISASFRVGGRLLSVHGTVRPGTKVRGGWRVLLEQHGRNVRTGRWGWAMRASGRLERHGTSSRFSLVWTAPVSTHTVLVRVVVSSGRRTLAISEVKRLSVTAPVRPVQVPPAAQPCGGESLAPKPGGGAWTCTFDDEFDASTGDPTALNTSWWVPQVTATSGYTTGPLGSEACYVNSANNISVSGGALHLTVRKEAAPFTCGLFTTQYTAGMVSTYTNFNQTYGRFEVRALLPQTTAAGLQETLWLWPINHTLYGATWPDSGEVDFSEFYSDYSSLDIPYIHYNYSPSTVSATTNTNTVTATNCQITLSQYNDYAVVWTPGSFTITINGNTCLVDNYVPDDGLTSPEPFDQPFFIALTQALGINANAFNPATTPLPATTSIDYVRVWK
jgi:beta-glucanase (GH16 family)